MKIAVNTRLLLKNRLEGIGWFTFETFSRIVSAHPEHQFIFLFDRPYSEEFIFSENLHPVVVSPQARHPFLFYYWFEHALPKVLKKIKADAFISPDGFVSLTSDVKTLSVVHDINFEHRPQDFPFLVKKYYHYFFPRFVNRADRIATVSDFSKKDLVSTYGASPDKIDVVYNGYNETYGPGCPFEKLVTRKQFARECPYFLYIGSLNPRKNIVNMLKAFDLYKQAEGGNMKLLIVGERMWKNSDDAIEKTYRDMAFREDVMFAGRLTVYELKNVLSAAEALLYVSFYEGFGIPLLEAMVSEVPVITSNVTSMPEVVNGAGMLVDPHSPGSISEAMIKIIRDAALRNELIEKGRRRAQEFSWQQTADKLWGSFEKMMEHGQEKKIINLPG